MPLTTNDQRSTTNDQRSVEQPTVGSYPGIPHSRKTQHPIPRSPSSIPIGTRQDYTGAMNDQTFAWVTFVLVAAIVVIAIVMIQRFWTAQLNMSDEDVAFERRISALNEGQANRRRDDEIVRLLRGEEQPIVHDDDRT